MTTTDTATQERRAFLNMYQGAQNALRKLQTRRPDIDYTNALKDCEKRIEELKQEVSCHDL